jgi:integrase
MSAGVADKVIAQNPCQLKKAGVEKAPERPVASVAEVEALAAAMPAHMRVLVLLAAWCQLRRGEVLGLRRQDIDLDGATVTIAVTRTQRMDGRVVEKAPKSEAGRRTLAVPANVVPVLADHLQNYARKAIGRPDLRLHDLRHSGLTWAAATGASVAELMRRGGHASPRAALRYQHATADRDRALADALANLAAPRL